MRNDRPMPRVVPTLTEVLDVPAASGFLDLSEELPGPSPALLPKPESLAVDAASLDSDWQDLAPAAHADLEALCQQIEARLRGQLSLHVEVLVRDVMEQLRPVLDRELRRHR
ncbi:hypothetical protein ACG0Z6_12930 [Roseateles sp. BYS180W]|uniref:Uncharacterized protein n=1 Tax=Roseateles rivi TaxID=3299028 RepID=A0ABW7FXW1_9BURK